MELKVTGLHLREYRAIRRLDLPADGLGWGGVFPDVVLVGGPNGSGKSTLLHWLVTALRGLHQGVRTDVPESGMLDVELDSVAFRYAASRAPLVALLLRDTTYVDGLSLAASSPTDGYRASRFGDLLSRNDGTQSPRVLFVPSPRELRLPTTERKTAGLLAPDDAFVHVWSAPRAWAESAEALLYEARWLDLNAKEEGHPEKAVHFARYADAFSSLVPGRRLAWRDGQLVVEVAGSSVVHGLEALSSGEKQVLLLLADLLRHWTPGSVVLLDEPELHLHPELQVRFYDALVGWRREKGGQLWLATQSSELFGHAPSGTKVLLGPGSSA